jgi:hypothetical protein
VHAQVNRYCLASAIKQFLAQNILFLCREGPELIRTSTSMGAPRSRSTEILLNLSRRLDQRAVSCFCFIVHYLYEHPFLLLSETYVSIVYLG